MALLTMENVKAPQWTEFAKLARINADSVFAEARKLKLKIAELTEELEKIKPRLQAKLEMGIDDPDVKSVMYEDMLMSRRAAYVRRSLDKRWAVKKLIAKGVKKAEIDEHTTETEIEASVSLRLLSETSEDAD